MTPRALTLAVLLALAFAPTAAAQNCEAPPGSAAVDQYCEAIPEGGGSQSSNDFQRSAAAGRGGEGGGGGNAPLPPGTAGALAAAGAEGAAVRELVQASRGTQAGQGGQPAAGDVAGASASNEDVSGSPLKAVSASVENGPVAGPLMIWALLATTMAIMGLVWVRFRSGGDAP